MSELSRDAFRCAFDRVRRGMEARYSVRFCVSDLVGRCAGDFDGRCVLLDMDLPDLDPEQALFQLAINFGHNVQWNTSKVLRRVGRSRPRSPRMLARHHQYEREAARVGLQLLREEGLSDLDRWLSDWFAAYWAYLEDEYRHKVHTLPGAWVRGFFQPGTGELLTPLPIPPFVPRQW